MHENLRRVEASAFRWRGAMAGKCIFKWSHATEGVVHARHANNRSSPRSGMQSCPAGICSRARSPSRLLGGETSCCSSMTMASRRPARTLLPIAPRSSQRAGASMARARHAGKVASSAATTADLRRKRPGDPHPTVRGRTARSRPTQDTGLYCNRRYGYAWGR